MNAKEKLTGGAIAIVRDAVKKEGLVFLFRGWTPSFIRLCPQTIVTFVVLEQQKKFWREWTGQ